MPKYLSIIHDIALLSGGTTEETIAPSISPANESPMRSLVMIPYSSAVRSRAVAMRHELIRTSSR